MFGKKKEKKVSKPAAKPVKKAPAEKAAKPAKKAAKPAPKKAEAKKPAAKKEVVGRTYHLVKRADGKWEVKYAGGQKAIKLFDNQKEAIAYTKEMAGNQDGGMVIHNSKGANKGRIQKK